jgi:NAD(P)-dependent dehydrogenase (short-subunit alcohol dehydrogenase family)
MCRLPLEGRVAVVSGVNHGIGAAAAAEPARLGADVVVTYLTYTRSTAIHAPHCVPRPGGTGASLYAKRMQTPAHGLVKRSRTGMGLSMNAQLAALLGPYDTSRHRLDLSGGQEVPGSNPGSPTTEVQAREVEGRRSR